LRGSIRSPQRIWRIVVNALARVLAQLGGAVAQRGHAVGGRMAEHRASVLDVVVERTVDVRDVAQRRGAQRDPVIVEVSELAGWERQRIAEQRARKERGGAGHAVRDKQRQEAVVIRVAEAPIGLSEQLVAGSEDALVAVDELCRADCREQRLELVRAPAIILVGEGDVRRLRWREREGALEVPIEAEPPRRARHDEPGIASDRRLEVREPLGRRAVVRDHAHPIAMRLRPDRFQLPAQQLGGRLVGGHADRDQRARARLRLVEWNRGHGGRLQLERAELGDRRATILELGAQLEPAATLARARSDARETPEAAAEAAQLRVVGRVRVTSQVDRTRVIERRVERGEDVAAWHSVCHQRLRLAVHQQLEPACARVRAETPAADEHRGARTNLDGSGQRLIELDVKPGLGKRHEGQERSAAPARRRSASCGLSSAIFCSERCLIRASSVESAAT
jgi:hypothetical protein